MGSTGRPGGVLFVCGQAAASTANVGQKEPFLLTKKRQMEKGEEMEADQSAFNEAIKSSLKERSHSSIRTINYTLDKEITLFNFIFCG